MKQFLNDIYQENSEILPLRTTIVADLWGKYDWKVVVLSSVKIADLDTNLELFNIEFLRIAFSNVQKRHLVTFLC